MYGPIVRDVVALRVDMSSTLKAALQHDKADHVILRRLEEWRHPHHVDPQALNVFELRNDTGDVADAIAVTVTK